MTGHDIVLVSFGLGLVGWRNNKLLLLLLIFPPYSGPQQLPTPRRHLSNIGFIMASIPFLTRRSIRDLLKGYSHRLFRRRLLSIDFFFACNFINRFRTLRRFEEELQKRGYGSRRRRRRRRLNGGSRRWRYS